MADDLFWRDGDGPDVKVAIAQEKAEMANDRAHTEARSGQMMIDFTTLRDAFGAFDADGDGKLTEAEVVAALTRATAHGTEFSWEEAHDTWKRWKEEFDLNNDGIISVDELARSQRKIISRFPNERGLK